MATFTTPVDVTTDELITAARFNAQVMANVRNLINPPAARVYHSTTQTAANGANQALAMNSERVDTEAMHDTATNNSRLTIVTTGLYAVGGSAEISATNNNTTGKRELSIRSGGTVWQAISGQPGQAAIQHLSVMTIIKMTAADYLELVFFQDSGNTLTINASGQYSPEFWATWIGTG